MNSRARDQRDSVVLMIAVGADVGIHSKLAHTLKKDFYGTLKGSSPGHTIRTFFGFVKNEVLYQTLIVHTQ